MASIISAGTTSGTSLNLSADTSGVLQLATNGTTTALTIDTSQNVGIGTASPSAPLDIQSNSGGTGIRIRGRASANAGAIRYFANDNTTQRAKIESNDTSLEINSISSLPITILTADTERMRIPAAGGVQAVTCVSVGNATPASTGAGITFPATQSASSNANTLDDYEEGTWTPTAAAQTGSLTSYTSSGTYTKIGRTVYLVGVIGLTNVGTASGQLFCGGLPFATLNTSARPAVPVCREDAATGVVYGGYVDSSSTSFTITSLTFGPIVWTNGFAYSFCFTYQTF
jgi:hypothetical protein